MSKTFADLGVSRAITDALDKRGITSPFAIQTLVLEDVLAGRDVLACSPTGSGKTLAFGLGLIENTASEARRPAALVLAPTRELATQIVDELYPLAHARALKVAAVYGGVGLEKQAREAAKAHIVVATPGRLEDQLQRRAFDLSHVRTLVLDEADRMLDMGFKPAVDRIVKLCPAGRQTLFFSATLDGDAGRVARTYTKDAVAHEHVATDIRKKAIEHRFTRVDRTERVDALLRELKAKDRELALVFVRTKRGADRLVKKLGQHGLEAVAMHGDKSQRQREKALARFEEGRVDTLVATDVAARGIDVDGISHVIQFDPPEDHDTYTHRVGRTGRAGRTGIGVTFVDADQAGDVAKIARALKLDDQFAASGLIGTVREQSGGGHRGQRKPAPRPSTAGRHGHGGGSAVANDGKRRRPASGSSSRGGSSRGGSSSR